MLLYNERCRYKFVFSLQLLPFNGRKDLYTYTTLYSLSYGPICGTLCLLNYCESIKTTFMMVTPHKLIRDNDLRNTTGLSMEDEF